MTKLITVLAIFFGAMADLGCTPTAQGGLVCGSERG